MIVVISPSKTFSKSNKTGIDNLLFPNEKEELFDNLRKLSKDDIKESFKLSPKLTEEVYSYFHDPLNIKSKTSAGSLYSGQLYQQLDYDNISFNNTNNNLYIISALYGLLNHLDNINKYRLDFNYKKIGNLYDYWNTKITDYFNNNYIDEIIIDLTSKEFYPLIKDVNNLVTIDFKRLDDKRVGSVLLKQARGLLANLIITRNVKTIGQLTQLEALGFTYNNKLSNAKNLVFTIKNIN